MHHAKKSYIFLSVLVVSSLLVAIFPLHVVASSLTLAWYSNTEDDLAGYSIYCGTRSRDYDRVIDVGDVNQYTVRGLKPETRYYFALTAYDMSGNESDFSAEASTVTDAKASPALAPSSESDGGCFVATAAYGSYLNPHVKELRAFRDTFLKSNSLGNKLVDTYYEYGPVIANYVECYPFLRLLTRQVLLPLVGISALSLMAMALPPSLCLPLSLVLILPLTLRPCSRQKRP